MPTSNPMVRAAAAATAATMVAVLLVASPAAAQESFSRATQPFDSTPVQPVAGAGSAFEDAAPNWSGGAADPVGVAGSGDWSATDLTRSGSWEHGGASGGFQYAYDLRVPPAAGPAPALELSYSSASHDGRTSGTNNQASWVGDGWAHSPSFIERTYAACADDDGGNQGDDLTGDLCWQDDSPTVTMSLDGASSALVRDDQGGQWRAEHDANWRIEQLGSPASPGTATTERWVVTTTDGTRHYFASQSSSRWTVPVFGNHAGEPCHSAGDFPGSRCQQAYRWMLDRTVDVHGNMARYTYQTATGRYSPAAGAGGIASYTREGWLQRIEYGLRDGSSGPAAAKVEFSVADRCLADCRDSGGDPEPDAWPDTPWDLHCKPGDGCETYFPAFFSTKRLTAVTTHVATGSGFDRVDSWDLTHEFKDYGDAEQVVLWLSSVQHTGHVGGTESSPVVEFGGTFLPNRVDAGEAWPTIWRPRLTSIRNETGGVTTINYSEPDCGPGDLPGNAHQNNRLCYPTRYTPEGLAEPVSAYFHKYVVRSIAESDATGGGDTVWTFYDYSTAGGGTSALWAWNDAEFLDEPERDWNQWRGYPQVVTRTGDPADPGPQLQSRTRYFRGMDGDRLPGGGTRSATVTDSQGNTATDHRSLAGLEWETAAYDGTTIIESETTWYWWSRTARRSYDGGALEAFLTRPERIDARLLLSGSAWRHTRTETSYDQYGRAVQVADSGDLAVSGDERCVRTTYADNTDAWLLALVSTVETVSVGCDRTPDRPADLIMAARAYYDGSGSHTTAPTRGLMTRSETVAEWDGGPVYVPTGESTFDSLGRKVTSTDPLGETTTTAYTPAGAGPVTGIEVTNPVGHISTTELNPAWGVAVETVAPDGGRTAVAYDPLGRRTEVWQPSRNPDVQGGNLRFSYQVSQTQPTTVTTERLLPDGAYRTDIEFYDSLLRPRQTQTQTRGGRLISQTVYDSYGRTRFRSGPAFNNESGPDGELVWITRTNDVARTELHYDGAGRVVDEVFVVKDEEQWRTSYSYGGHDRHWLTTTIAPHGGTSTAILADARGRTVELRQYHNRTAAGDYDATTYQHHPGGQLARATDPAGNTWQFEYDLLGRRIAWHDPDAGTRTATYNTAGQLTSASDGNGTTVSHVYDQIGRPAQVWVGAVDSGELMIERSYDGAVNGTGRPHTATHWVDGEPWQTTVTRYAPDGQPTQIATQLPDAAGPLAGTYWESFTYYPDGSMLSSNAIGAGGLAREPVTYFYDELGQPTRVTSSGDNFGEGRVYVDAAVYSPYGQLLQRRLGDPDQVGGASGQAWQTWVYEEGTGRLAEFYFDKDSAGEFTGTNYGVAALSYQYDDAGNVLAVTDEPVHSSPHLAPETECYQYDHLRRLTEAWAQGGTGECATAPSADVVGGPGAYWSSYEYDPTGNRVGHTEWQSGERVGYDYQYPPAGQPQPHLLTEVAGPAPGVASTAFSYDQAGFTTAVDRDGEVDELSWTAAGRLESIETADGVTRFVDDAEGNRIFRADPNGDLTAWVAGYELTYSAVSGTVRATRYYHHGGDAVGVRIDHSDIRWLAADQHGTNQWVVNGDTLTVANRRLDPFGNQRSASTANWPDQRGFVGGIANSQVQLTTVGAREYHPATGRFISRDPVADFTDPQQLNGYAYANNNPVTWSDPTGLLPQGPRVGTPGTPSARRVTPPSRGGSGGTPEVRPRNVGSPGTPSRTRAAAPGRWVGPTSAEVRGPDVHQVHMFRQLDLCTVIACRVADDRGQRDLGATERSVPPRTFHAEDPTWKAVDDLWSSTVGGLCDPVDMVRVNLVCSYLDERPPKGVGWCNGASAGLLVGVAGSQCMVYTRQDGWVVTHQGGGIAGGVAGGSVTTGPMITSSGSAAELEGWSTDVAAEGGIPPVSVGGSTSISDSGDWTSVMGGGVGFCVWVCNGTGGRSYTHAESINSPGPFWWL